MSSHAHPAPEPLAYGAALDPATQALAWLEEHGGSLGHFTGGRWTAPRDPFETLNPATGHTLALLSHGSAGDVDAAVRAAREALPGWRALSDHARARRLHALAEGIDRHSHTFAPLAALDTGRPIRVARDVDVALAAAHFRHHAGRAQVFGSHFPDRIGVGVVAQILAASAPLLSLARKVAPVLAAGSTVVLKPAAHTSLTALRFARLCTEVDLPPGVVNVVTGDGRTGALLADHSDVDAIGFGGSLDAARAVRAASAGSGKLLRVEADGRGVVLVFDDADLDSAVEAVVEAAFVDQGQASRIGSPILVQEGRVERFVEKLRNRMAKLRTGSPLDAAVDVGPVVTAGQLERLKELVARATAAGAACWRPSWSGVERGCFYPPTLLTGVPDGFECDCYGPVVSVMTFRTPAEAVARVGRMRHLPAASVWTESVSLALGVAARMRAGTVRVNATGLLEAASGRGGAGVAGREELMAWLRDEPSEAPGPRSGALSAVAARGTRQDVDAAVDAARAAAGWGGDAPGPRGQQLYDMAEHLGARAREMAGRLPSLGAPDGSAEVAASVACLYSWAALADKHDGAVAATVPRTLTLVTHEPVGVVGIVCPDDAPLLALVSLVAPALAMGNTVVVVPSERAPLAATEFHAVLTASELPAGSLSILTGRRAELAAALAAHDEVDALWYHAGDGGGSEVERLSAGNLKRTWIGSAPLWRGGPALEHVFLRHATRVKHLWVPFGA